MSLSIRFTCATLPTDKYRWSAIAVEYLRALLDAKFHIRALSANGMIEFGADKTWDAVSGAFSTEIPTGNFINIVCGETGALEHLWVGGVFNIAITGTHPRAPNEQTKAALEHYHYVICPTQEEAFQLADLCNRPAGQMSPTELAMGIPTIGLRPQPRAMA